MTTYSEKCIWPSIFHQLAELQYSWPWFVSGYQLDRAGLGRGTFLSGGRRRLQAHLDYLWFGNWSSNRKQKFVEKRKKKKQAITTKPGLAFSNNKAAVLRLPIRGKTQSRRGCAKPSD